MSEKEKTLTIPLKIRDGKMVTVGGKSLPYIKDRTEFEITVPKESIIDIDRRGIIVPFFNNDTPLLVGVRSVKPSTENGNNLKNKGKYLYKYIYGF